MKSPSEKMQEEIKKHVSYWQTEFDMDKWQVAGVMFDIAMDVLMVIEGDDDEDDCMNRCNLQISQSMTMTMMRAGSGKEKTRYRKKTTILEKFKGQVTP